MEETELLNALSHTLASVDDAALGSLTSVGLVRRARKDLEKGEASEFKATPNGVVMVIADATVTMPVGGPAAATCTCPAGGRCRHVLVATLFLQQRLAGATLPDNAVPCPSAAQVPSGEVAPPPRDSGPAELLALTFDDLVKWVGRKTLREAANLLETMPELAASSSEGGSVIVRFPHTAVEVRYLPGGGLEGLIATAPAKTRERFLAAAVLAIRRSGGVRDESETSRRETADAAVDHGGPRSREQVIASAQALLVETVSIGLSHPSSSTRDRLRTLSVSAQGVQLPRLSLALRGLAEETDLLLRRDAQADEAKLFISTARTFALASALASEGSAPKPALAGRSRSRYDVVGNLDLTGVAAYPWQTRSGYEGLTLLFWDSSARRWCTWSDSRPGGRDAGFSAVARYEQDLPWHGAGTARRMCRARFRLLDAMRNDQGRLSGSERMRAIVTDDANVGAIDFGNRAFDDWRLLRRHFASVLPAGLSQPHPLDAVVVVRPAAWGRRGFRSDEQALVWAMHDSSGAALMLRVPYEHTNRSAVEALNALDMSGGSCSVVGRLEYFSGDVILRPYSLLRPEGPPEQRVQNLGLEIFAPATAATTSPKATLVAAPSQPAESDDEQTEEDGDAAATDAPQIDTVILNPAWREFEDRLQHMAESGARLSARLRQDLPPLSEELEAMGLRPLAAIATTLSHSTWIGSSLLAARYVCTLVGELAVRLAFENAGAPEATQ
jgi:hypothetical protein